jgi:alanyl-tRNA synthetase
MVGVRLERADAGALQTAADTPLYITGRALFILWDTYGFPRELTKEIAVHAGFSIDPNADEEFDVLMEQQRERGRAAAQGDPGALAKLRERVEKTYRAKHGDPPTAARPAM